jgi:hypothetical protein
MNCDDVLQHLTSRPPQGRDAQLERHLAGCASCRDMANLFRPAADLLIGDLTDGETAEAPEGWQRIWDAVAVAERAARQLKERPAPPSMWRARARMLGRSVAILLAGVLLGSILTRVGMPDQFVANGQEGVPITHLSSLPDGAATGRCERLISEIRRSSELGLCLNCKQETTSASGAIALCMICHVNSR